MDRDTAQRRRIQVQGVVQGVGFRPHVYGLAIQLGLTGFVGNDSSGVFIEIEGAPEKLSAFQKALESSPPPLAHLEQLRVSTIEPCGDRAFSIVASHAQPLASTLISPDLTVCEDCLRELLDPQDRRHGYPFINCTNCGPRFTITKAIPYDRPLTTMAPFVMCPACQAEYDDPLNRRFHAQPNACATCGPRVWFVAPREQELLTLAPLAAALQETAPISSLKIVLQAGGIVAIKGVGGFHLACDATNDHAVQRLRNRKGRAHKPLAIMVTDLETARQVATINEDEATLLTSRQRPIVLLNKRCDSPLSAHVAPGNGTVGVMLPYTPLHYLLFQPRTGSEPTPADVPCQVLVMTSANYSSQPIVTENDAAIAQLADLADGFLLHDRAIHLPCDDSVVRLFRDRELPIRRSRGYAPFPVKLPFALQSTLAVGGELKSTFCLGNENHAFMSQHIGDMENWETLQAFNHAVDHFKGIFRIEPTLIACDAHPGYLSTRWANEHHGSVPLIAVQHHHAHVAAVMAEHGIAQGARVIGVAFDGTGYGWDGTIWGGEIFVADYATCQRVAHLATVPLPGGDAAIHKPYRMALAHLWAAGVAWTADLPPVAACSATERAVLKQQFTRRLNVVETSSMGRLFDAVAALTGVQQTVTYEAQAAIEFEALAGRSAEGTYPWLLEGDFAYDPAQPTSQTDRMIHFLAAPLLRAIIADLQHGVAVGTIALKFHRAVADLILQLAQRVRAVTGLGMVALSGGVFQNVLLLELTVARLVADNFVVLTHQQVPPNDGGLALGQAVVANAMVANAIDEGKNHEIS